MVDLELLKARLKRLLKRQWCPKCYCIDVEEIYFSIPAIGNYKEKAKQLLRLKDRPTESFRCCKCCYIWPNPKFEKYISRKVGIV